MSTSNHSSPYIANKSASAICVWVFHDHRLGHVKQLRGLVARLEAQARIHSCWLDIQDQALGLKHLFLAPDHLKSLPHPNIILGAGHKTHWSVLLAARHYQAFSTLVMKPSLPLSWFDAIICPEHDQVSPAENILNTFGPLNCVIPPEDSQDITPRSKHLILVGGPSRHFRFDTHSLLNQIQQLCQESPQRHWILSSSPRTPTEMLAKLSELNLANLEIHEYRDQSLEPLDTLLNSADSVWLTPDSMAMIFEALTAGASVGVFEDAHRPGKAKSRISQQVHALICSQTIVSFSNRADKPTLPTKTLWETDRAARWLLQRYASHQQQVNESHA